MVLVWVLCVVRSPYGVPGQVRQVQRTTRVDHYLRVGVLFEVPDPNPEPEPEPDGGQD